MLAGKSKNQKRPSEVSAHASGLSGHLSKVSGKQWERVDGAVHIAPEQ